MFPIVRAFRNAKRHAVIQAWRKKNGNWAFPKGAGKKARYWASSRFKKRNFS